MDENRIGPFIAELRKENKMTQKELAEKLHITDKAVSKWERGLSCPDITLLTSIADIFGVTANELLNGQRRETTDTDMENSIDHAFIYAEKTAKRKMVSVRNVLTLIFSILMLLGIVVCSVCDVAISGMLTWSRYPISSIIFAWLIFAPLIKYGNKGALISLAAYSILIIPFLFVISKILGGSDLIMSIGIRISLLSMIYLWCVYLIFKRLKARKMIAVAFSLLLTIPLCFAINLTLSIYILEPLIDIWDVISFVAILVSAVFFYKKQK